MATYQRKIIKESTAVDEHQSSATGSAAHYLPDHRDHTTIQKKTLTSPIVDNRPAKNAVGLHLEDNRTRSVIQQKTNDTGLPDQLKTGIEKLSGYQMDDVKVHFNSSKPAQLQAHAYAQGTQIHLGPGQEKHLAHEAWHVVQQKQGRVKPTLQMKGHVNVNDDKGLEHEADVFGAKAMQFKLIEGFTTPLIQQVPYRGVVQKAGWGDVAAVAGVVGGALAGGAAGYLGGAGLGLSLGLGLAGAGLGYVTPFLGRAAAGVATGTATHGHVHAAGPLTQIKHTAGYITLDQKNYEVGKKMEARLSAKNPITGSATGPNWTWMQALRAAYPQANIVRGHLLNHDLGGFGMPENLYPISTLANSAHSDQVEQPVKKLLAIEIGRADHGHQPKFVNYMVNVAEAKANNPAVAAFNCTFYTDGQAPNHVKIESDLGADKGGFGGGIKTNPLDGTLWHHGARRGFETGDEQTSLAKNKTDQNITVEKTKGVKLEGNVNAKYVAGAGLTQETEENIFGNLMRDVFNHWSNALQQSILIELKTTLPFDKGVLAFVRTTASYEDNKGDAYSLIELIIQVLEEQIEKLKKEHQHEPLNMAILNSADQDISRAIAYSKKYFHNQ
ncbi:DUF4157 domain-containing protein [Pedobacter sp. Hv1]|uniref:eCIS core domain-containing protein n=1 Tax=Pedobacter sp. Hv1 TaxID=1740090 RepID=UPI0009E9C3C2|nr:DUF4157 domain-containing protein [Pedobacter sp. Hv1]